jgi:hypothetical protein
MEEFLETFCRETEEYHGKKRLVLPMYELTIRTGDQWSYEPGCYLSQQLLEDI